MKSDYCVHGVQAAPRHVAQSAHLFSWARSDVLCSLGGADMLAAGVRRDGECAVVVITGERVAMRPMLRHMFSVLGAG